MSDTSKVLADGADAIAELMSFVGPVFRKATPAEREAMNPVVIRAHLAREALRAHARECRSPAIEKWSAGNADALARYNPPASKPK